MFHQFKKNFDLGSSGKIYCLFKGYQANIVWKKEGLEKLPEKVKADKSSLIFDNIDHKDAGKYICIGSNSFSNQTSYVNVSVSGK